MKRITVYCMLILQMLFLAACGSNDLELTAGELAVRVTYNHLTKLIDNNNAFEKGSLNIVECYIIEGYDDTILRERKDDSGNLEKFNCIYVYYSITAKTDLGTKVVDEFAYCVDEQGKITAETSFSEIQLQFEEGKTKDNEVAAYANAGIGTASGFSGWTEFTSEDIERVTQ